MADVFEEIRNSLPIQTVARFYGINVSKSGMACCPFHDDHVPSLKLYKSDYYCFGCGAGGDTTNLVARLYRVRQIDAAKIISYDFGLGFFDKEFAAPIVREPTEYQKFNIWLKNAGEAVNKYVSLLKSYKEKYYPRRFSEDPDPRFTESLQKLGYAEYLSELIKSGSEEEKRDLYLNGKPDIEKIEEKLKLAVRADLPKRRLI